LRVSMTSAEIYLWERVRKKQLDGLRFRAQHPIADFVVDFYCHKAKLVIEIDEKYHNNPTQKEDDENRDSIINEFGLDVLRFTDKQVMEEIEWVIETIKNYLPK